LTLDMLPHVLSTAWRHARRHLGTTLLNGIGLALGLTAALLVAAFIRHETTYDRHHPEAERLYRVQAVYDRWLGRDRVSHQMESPTGVVPVLRNDVPGVERVSEGRICSDNDGDVLAAKLAEHVPVKTLYVRYCRGIGPAVFGNVPDHLDGAVERRVAPQSLLAGLLKRLRFEGIICFCLVRVFRVHRIASHV